jgi:hypothetical protein
LIAVNLSKVPAEAQVELWKQLPRSNIYAESTAYHRSIWAQEVTIHQSIPATAIYSPFAPMSQVSVLPVLGRSAAITMGAAREPEGKKP